MLVKEGIRREVPTSENPASIPISTPKIKSKISFSLNYLVGLHLPIEYSSKWSQNIVTRLVFDALSIGEGPVAAV